MKLVLFGASGMIGSRILAEALYRGHSVRAVTRSSLPFTGQQSGVTISHGDVLNSTSVAEEARDVDALLSAYGPGQKSPAEAIVSAAKSLISGAKAAGVSRLLVVGGAGGLEVAPGVQLMDTPDFPPIYKPYALAHREALELYRASDLDWTFICPSAAVEPGTRTGRYRNAGDQLLVDSVGKSWISAEDFAAGFLDELIDKKYIRRRMTIGY